MGRNGAGHLAQADRSRARHPDPEGQAIHESHPSETASAILSSRSQTSHRKTHRRFTLTIVFAAVTVEHSIEKATGCYIKNSANRTPLPPSWTNLGIQTLPPANHYR